MPAAGVAMDEALAAAGAVAVAEADAHRVRVDARVGVADAHTDAVPPRARVILTVGGCPSTSRGDGAESVDCAVDVGREQLHAVDGP